MADTVYKLMMCGTVLLLLCSALLLTSNSGLADNEGPQSIPEPAPIVDYQGHNILNILLLGSDTNNPINAGRTDVILIVSINRSTDTISLLSIPRDLYVYIPGWSMQRINTAYSHGESRGGEGGGAALLKETILYNLGIPVDFYARVDFNGFKQIIDSIGGIEISVDCAIQDWRLLEPDLDITLEENWAIFTLPVGVHWMDGDLALWYVRSRRTSSDFDRGRRQQDMVRALWRRVNQMGLIGQLPDIWPQVVDMVKTDMTLPDLLALAPIALRLDANHITSHTFRLNTDVRQGYSPQGSSVLLPLSDGIAALIEEFLAPATANQIVQERTTVEIINASGIAGLEYVAADRLSWAGFLPIISTERMAHRQYTTLYDYTGRSKGNVSDMLQSLLRVGDESLFREPDAERISDYRVILGSTYYSCTYNVLPPRDLSSEDH